ncbi:hypothetical protein CI105_04690 [Candidatus Izimaplasma bacterium ZiA1]|uniref:amidase family protein n=1 Tax=Candidatus Izimoplasma sp. ZiA1 TaxID=2024899 RepID=UPI000BAA3825|nr:hypothetical protein CI105_04690 [Candidatus Izimaplasma bacterium ZiA1]
MKYNSLDKYKRISKRLSDNQKSVLNVIDCSKQINRLVEDNQEFYLLGVKNTEYINEEVLEKLDNKNFIKHTIDKMSLGGRAVDIDLINPITGKIMTGSSSGTAINVLNGFNDIGIGTDGGGSVLAPAMALNLYGIISPLFYRDEAFKKSSTDGIKFVPAIGFISKDIELIKKAVGIFVNQEKVEKIKVLIPEVSNIYLETKQDIGKTVIDNLVVNDKISLTKSEFPNIFLEREGLITFLENELNTYDAIITYEGPIDYYGFGDSVFGLFNDIAKADQQKAGKGLIRVANMANKSALVVPSNDFSSGYVIISNSTKKGVQTLFELEALLSNKLNNKLYDRYFTL